MNSKKKTTLQQRNKNRLPGKDKSESETNLLGSCITDKSLRSKDYTTLESGPHLTLAKKKNIYIYKKMTPSEADAISTDGGASLVTPGLTEQRRNGLARST